MIKQSKENHISRNAISTTRKTSVCFIKFIHLSSRYTIVIISSRVKDQGRLYGYYHPPQGSSRLFVPTAEGSRYKITQGYLHRQSPSTVLPRYLISSISLNHAQELNHKFIVQIIHSVHKSHHFIRISTCVRSPFYLSNHVKTIQELMLYKALFSFKAHTFHFI